MTISEALTSLNDRDLKTYLRKMNSGFKDVKFYVWMDSTGKILSDVTTEPTLQWQEHNQGICDAEGLSVRLCELGYKETVVRLLPPPPEEFNGKRRPGGHAIGGSAINSIDDAATEMTQIIERNFKNKIWFWKTENSVNFQFENVKAWVLKLDKPIPDPELFSPKLWQSYVTMVNGWNEDYHDVLLGSYSSGHKACNEAFLGFMKFQLEEQYLEGI